MTTALHSCLCTFFVTHSRSQAPAVRGYECLYDDALLFSSSSPILQHYPLRAVFVCLFLVSPAMVLGYVLHDRGSRNSIASALNQSQRYRGPQMWEDGIWNTRFAPREYIFHLCFCNSELQFLQMRLGLDGSPNINAFISCREGSVYDNFPSRCEPAVNVSSVGATYTVCKVSSNERVLNL